MSMNLDKPYDSQSIEGTSDLTLDFFKLVSDNQNVIPVAVQNAITEEIILIAYTNELAFNEAIKQKKAIFWSTSRNEMWYKGIESGNTFSLQSIYVNCEQNSLVYKVIPDKDGICHVTQNGVANNCFYRELDLETLELKFRVCQ